MSESVLNFNVGVLGHVDSGKTSLARALSSTASTAAFDKNPQSRERGITLDLGFSSFTVDLPDHLRHSGDQQPHSSLQFTLVDCPGHASLIRTIIGGAQIIDLMMLVVDVVKGMQTQTAECLLIGELTCPRMVVVLNKIDLLPPSKRESAIEKMTKRMHKTLESTRFKDCPVIAVAAKPGGPDALDTEEPQGVSDLIELLKKQTYLPQRDPGGDFLMAVDHCFSIRGQGTVMTGTILQGSLAINDTVEIPALKVTKKVKSLQMFRKPVSGAMQGDRVGVCVTQFDPKLLERGLVCTPGSLRTLHAAVISVKKIGYFKGVLATRTKFHITVGHETVMAKVTFFGLPPACAPAASSDTKPTPQPWSLEIPFSFNAEYFYQDEYVIGQGEASLGPNPDPQQWALLEFERLVTCPSLCLVIGSKLDTDIHANACRLAFQGRLLQGFEDKSYAETSLPQLRIYKTKHKEGQVERRVFSQKPSSCYLQRRKERVEIRGNKQMKTSPKQSSSLSAFTWILNATSLIPIRRLSSPDHRQTESIAGDGDISFRCVVESWPLNHRCVFTGLRDGYISQCSNGGKLNSGAAQQSNWEFFDKSMKFGTGVAERLLLDFGGGAISDLVWFAL